MKHLRFLLLAALLPLAARAGSPAFSLPGTSVTNGTHNVSFAIVPASGNRDGAGLPRVEYLNLVSDLTNATVTFFKAHAQTRVTAASSGGTNRLLVASGTITAATNTLYVLWHQANDTYERLVSATNNSTAIVTLTAATAAAVAVNDVLFQMTNNGAIQFNSAMPLGTVKEINPAMAVYNGAEAEPILVQVSRTAAGTLNLLSGSFSTK